MKSLLVGNAETDIYFLPKVFLVNRVNPQVCVGDNPAEREIQKVESWKKDRRQGLKIVNGCKNDTVYEVCCCEMLRLILYFSPKGKVKFSMRTLMVGYVETFFITMSVDVE